ncbi:hypothetical protein [Ammoniphilus resinae]|uniref:Aminodeoxychorismate lyase n=1 Tax=Ammoniphilus resinae TaxID=861532 RepID=A0ABS4GMF4_9BACL|nr:hypothetical protein [Ammoniphilus resinae]MBP1931453.1 hypothetical protein [Ammoniphilus resinae]
MMDKQSLLLGAGLGMILSAVVLHYIPPLFGPATDPSVSPPPKSAPLTVEQGEKWMSEHGYVVMKQKQWNEYEKKRKELEANPPKSTITIYIQPGSNVEGIERMLVGAGLLPQQNQFIRLMKEKDLTRRVRTGAYTFEGKVNEELIIEEITRQR